MTTALRFLARALATVADAVLAPPRVDLEARLDPWTYDPRPGSPSEAARPGQGGAS